MGHQKVLEEIAERARRSSRRSVLVTFEPHPLKVVNPRAAPHLLTLPHERREILAQSELDAAVFMKFTEELSQYSPRAFVELLLSRFHLKELVIGYDHGFGRGRAGDVRLLEQLGESLGFAVDVVAEVDVEGRPVSSTLVRRAVSGGDLDTARRLLGRPYSLTGDVIRGSGRGAEVGYRTVNLEPPDPDKLLPPDGVYAVTVEWRDGRSGGMMHQGPRPTFGEDERSLEVHLLDARADLYGETLKLSWVRRIREVRAFPSREALKAQLDRDFEVARAALTPRPGLASH